MNNSTVCSFFAICQADSLFLCIAGGDGEIEKILLPPFPCKTILIFTKKIIGETFSGASDFFEPVLEFRIVQSQIEKLESSLRSTQRARLIPLFAGIYGAPDLAADIGHLLEQ